MSKIITTCNTALKIVLTAGVFGSLNMGCIPINEYQTTQYNIAGYTPNTDGTGLAGTWVVTLNNEIPPQVDLPLALFQRDLIRVKPIEGAPDTFEVTYCDATPAALRTTVVAAGNTISLPIADSGFADFTSISNGRLISIAPFSEDGTAIHRAVRLSSNPDADAGTVGIDFADDDADTVQQPTVCFGENLLLGPHFEEIRIARYTLRAAGASASGTIAANVIEEPSSEIAILSGSDSNGHQLAGSAIDNINTTQTSVQGVSGTVVTQGDANSLGAGSLVFDVKLLR